MLLIIKTARILGYRSTLVQATHAYDGQVQNDADRNNAAHRQLQLSFDILNMDHHRASRPRKFYFYRINDAACIENLASTDDETSLTRAASSLHLLGSDQQLYTIISAEIFLRLMIVPGREDDHIFLDAKNAHVVAPVADNMRAVISCRNDSYKLSCLADITTNTFNLCHCEPLLPWDNSRDHCTLKSRFDFAAH